MMWTQRRLTAKMNLTTRKDELDIMRERVHGTRRSERNRNAPSRLGFQLNIQQIDFVQTGSEDSEANGMDGIFI